MKQNNSVDDRVPAQINGQLGFPVGLGFPVHEEGETRPVSTNPDEPELVLHTINGCIHFAVQGSSTGDCVLAFDVDRLLAAQIVRALSDELEHGPSPRWSLRVAQAL